MLQNILKEEELECLKEEPLKGQKLQFLEEVKYIQFE